MPTGKLEILSVIVLVLMGLTVLSLGSWGSSVKRFQHTYNAGNTDDRANAIRFHGVKIKVVEMRTGKKFYARKLGFDVRNDFRTPRQVILDTNAFPLILESVPNSQGNPGPIRIAFQVYKLLPAIDHFRTENVHVEDTSLKRNGIGIHINFDDPFGNTHSLIEVQVRPVVPFRGSRIYNAGVSVNDMKRGEEFYTGKLGFSALSRDYLPDALPLKHGDGSFAFMLHLNRRLPDKIETGYPENVQTLFIFSTPAIQEGIQFLKMNGIELIFEEPENDHLGKYVAFKDPFGNVSELYELKNLESPQR